jgi:signal transduction histidine kinase
VEVRLEQGVGLPKLGSQGLKLQNMKLQNMELQNMGLQNMGLQNMGLQGVGLKNDGVGGPEAVVRVTDSGPGVPEDALDKLFRPFYRIDDARGRQTGGVGLGLAITDRAVRLHGGTIRVSNRPQGGLMVEIRLPLSSAEVTNMADQRTVTILSREL